MKLPRIALLALVAPLAAVGCGSKEPESPSAKYVTTMQARYPQGSEAEILDTGVKACGLLTAARGDGHKIAVALSNSKVSAQSAAIVFSMRLAAETICPEWGSAVAAW